MPKQSYDIEPAAPALSAPIDRFKIEIRTAREIGHLIRAARTRRKLTQQAFADLAGVGRRFVSELENGKSSLEFDKVVHVAIAAGIDLFARPR